MKRTAAATERKRCSLASCASLNTSCHFRGTAFRLNRTRPWTFCEEAGNTRSRRGWRRSETSRGSHERFLRPLVAQGGGVLKGLRLGSSAAPGSVSAYCIGLSERHRASGTLDGGRTRTPGADLLHEGLLLRRVSARTSDVCLLDQRLQGRTLKYQDKICFHRCASFTLVGPGPKCEPSPR